MTKTALHRIFSTIIALVILLPFAIQTSHAFEKHDESSYCSAENEKHFHQKEIDCHFYHLKISYNSYDFNGSFTVFKPQTYFQIFDDYHQTYFYSFQSSKSSRAPPYFIV